MRLNAASAASRPDTSTYEGAPAYTLSPRDELATLVAGSLLGESTFYESGDDRRKRIDALVPQCEPEFVAKLAVYARRVWNLRTVSLYLALSLAATRKDSDTARVACWKVIRRADEIREMLAGALQVFGSKKKIPYAVRNGIAAAMNDFDQYAYAKYQGGSGGVSFKDVLRILHPKPLTEKTSAIFASIMSDTLTMPEGSDTWERIISADGSTKEAWRKAAGVMPYMATLRNLRNLVQNDAMTDEVLARITDPKQVAKSKQLPIRFLSAARELQAAGAPSKVVQAVMDAAEHSLESVPLLGERVCVVVDVSGSMSSPISAKSSLRCMDVACMMGASLAIATLRKGGEATVVPFATNAGIAPVVARDIMLRVANGLAGTSNQLGGGTEIGAAWEAVKGREFDAIVVFSDMQVMDGANIYARRNTPAPEAALRVSFDLLGYGKTPFVERNGWHLMGGWSDHALAALSVLRDKRGIANIVDGYDWRC